MRWLRACLLRVAGLWRKEKTEREFAAELEVHLQMRTEEFIRRGLSPADARRAARLESGGLEVAKEAWRDRRGFPWLESLLRDFRYAFRALGKQPVFTLVAALTLALGIGANTAIFSLLYRVLLRPLPYPDAQRLVFVWNSYAKAGGEPSRVSIPDFLDRRSQAPAIEDAALFTPRDANLLAGREPESIIALAVTPSFFSTLQRGPSLGRAFNAADAVSGAPRITVLTHALWESRFAADPGVVGRDVRIDGQPYIVAGVLPADFELPWPRVSLLVPFAFSAAQTSDQERGNEFSLMIARLRPGASIARVNAQMNTIVTGLIDRLPARAAYMRNSGFTGIAVGMRDQMVGDVRIWLWLLQGGVGVVLLIACANVANLLLMRATGRHRELAIRMALGAGMRRITQQLVMEGAVLALCGAVGGVALAVFGVRGLLAMTADQFPEMRAVVVHPVILAFTAAIAAVTAIVFGLAPSFAMMRSHTSTALNEATARASAGRRTGAVRAALVIAETALAVILLVSAGLLIKGFLRLERVDPGFSARRVLTAEMSLPSSRYGSGDAVRTFWARVLEGVRAVPGVNAAGLISRLPFSGEASAGTFQVVGRALGPSERPPHARQDFVMGDYFRAIGIPVLQGRPFDDRDSAGGTRVVVVDQFLASRQFPGRSPIGEQLNFGSPRNYTIIGVVGSINDSDLAAPIPEGHVYLNAVQIPLRGMGLVVKSGVEPLAIAPSVRDAVRAIDGEQPLAQVRAMEEWLSRSLKGRRTPMTLLALFGAVALMLSAIGIYGVLAFGVSQRVRELGIRQALGANPAAIMSLVLGQGLRLVGTGLVMGLAGAAVLTRFLQSMLFGVGGHDPVVFAGVALLLLGVAGLAAYIPARRATGVDPIIALRES